MLHLISTSRTRFCSSPPHPLLFFFLSRFLSAFINIASPAANASGMFPRYYRERDNHENSENSQYIANALSEGFLKYSINDKRQVACTKVHEVEHEILNRAALKNGGVLCDIAARRWGLIDAPLPPPLPLPEKENRSRVSAGSRLRIKRSASARSDKWNTSAVTLQG